MQKFIQNPEMFQRRQRFQFVKGILWRAIEQNDWILFDEINLASEETLMKLYQLFKQDSITLLDSNKLQQIRKPEGFRIFACMNPGYEVGKKPLPQKIQECFTVILCSPID